MFVLLNYISIHSYQAKKMYVSTCPRRSEEVVDDQKTIFGRPHANQKALFYNLNLQ